ncbi:amino acid ABC transporter permease [Pseudomonas monteilii]|uniref:amino acid ABC transporter permease n=1 Tax=Pseudomonas monteilii TaxID=76759 RepID=UPI003D08D3C4
MSTSFDFSVIWTSLPYLLSEGMVFTLKLMLFAGVSGLLLGGILASLRMSNVPLLSGFVAVYVYIFRSVPLVLALFWFYFLVPFIGGWVSGTDRPLVVGPLVAAYVTFALYEAAYFSEIIRAGIKAIPKGQVSAAAALGMSHTSTMIYVILPQALVKMLPIFLTQVIILFQDTSLVYVLSLTDFFGAAVKVAQRDNKLVEMYTLIAFSYLVISQAGSMYVQRLQKRLALRIS